MPKLTPAMEKTLRILNQDNAWHSAWGLNVSANTLNALVKRGLVETIIKGVRWNLRFYRRKQDGS